MNKILFCLVFFISSIAVASFANELYVDQIGNGLDLTITQTGNGNAIGSNTQSVELTGNNMTFAITQDGDNNIISAIISGNTYTGTWVFNGNDNTVDLTCGATNGANCENVTLDITTNGSTNTFNVYIGEEADSQGLAATFTVDGDNNVVNTTVNGANATLTVKIDSTGKASGNNLTMTVTGDGATGNTGHSINLDHTGGGGNITINQTGNAENNKIDMNSSGDNANVSITQSN
jgi:hypothetical protein